MIVNKRRTRSSALPIESYQKPTIMPLVDHHFTPPRVTPGRKQPRTGTSIKKVVGLTRGISESGFGLQGFDKAEPPPRYPWGQRPPPGNGYTGSIESVVLGMPPRSRWIRRWASAVPPAPTST